MRERKRGEKQKKGERGKTEREGRRVKEKEGETEGTVSITNDAVRK